MTEYVDMTYPELKKLVADRGLKASGKKDDLINKLVAQDLGLDPEPEPEPKKVPKDKYKGLKPTDPNPDNPNWDMAGRWIRRHKGWQPPK